MRALAVSAVCFILCLALPGAPATAATFDADSKRFLATLEGAWRGQAVRTPVGVRPYDIVFRASEEADLAGTADTGAALHHWHFLAGQNALRLRFLSTFRGNERPRWLTVTGFADKTAVFEADGNVDLTVCVTPKSTAATIQIFLRGQPHVRIELTRARAR